MSLKKSTPSLYIALLFLAIFTSTASAQTVNSVKSKAEVNQAKLLAQVEETTAPDTITFTPRVGVGYTTEGSGFNPYSSFDGFFPLMQTPGKSLTFVEGKMLWDTDTSALGGNLLLGHRFINGAKNRVTGGYISYDSRNTGNATFNQLGLGLESLGENVDFRLNGYIPLGNTSSQLAASFPGTASFQGNSLQIDRVRLLQESLTGADLEVGTKLTSWNNGGLRGYVGGYVYGGDNISTFAGVRGRVVGTWDGLQAGLSLQNDSRFDTRLVFNIGASLGGNRSRGQNQSVLARMGDSVQRESSILVDNQIVKDTITAINPNGGLFTPTTSANFSTVLAAAKPNDTVYVQADASSTIAGFTVPDKVQVLSSGASQSVNTQVGNVAIAGSGTGVLPKVTGTITLASNGSNQTLSGFAVTNTASQAGIIGTNNTNATIKQNQVTINGKNTDTILAGRGIVLVGANGTTNIDSNTVRNAIGEGIRLDNVSGKANITNNTVLNTIQPQTQTGLEASIFIRNNRGDVDLTIASNTVGDNNTRATFNNDGSAITSGGNEIDGIEFSLCRSYAAPVLDTFAKCSGTATAKVSIVNNTVRNIGALGVDGADGIDINLNNNDDTTDAGARVGSLTISGNKISNIADKGVSFGVDGDAVLGLGTVSNNTVDTVGDIGLALRSRFNSSSNYAVSGNSITKAGGNGIEYILTQATNNSVSTGVISNNTITNSGANGIAVGSRNTSKQTVTVSNNTITNSAAVGISLDARDINSTTTATISNNKVADSGTNGISILSRNTSQATATVSNNTITNSLTTANIRGIDVETRDSGKLELTLDANTVSGATADGIRIRAGSNTGASVANVIVKNNDIRGNNTAAVATSADLAATSGSNSNFCLRSQNNKAGTTATTGYFLSRTGTSTFRLEDSFLASNTGVFRFNPAVTLTSTSTLPVGTVFTTVPAGTCGAL